MKDLLHSVYLDESEISSIRAVMQAEGLLSEAEPAEDEWSWRDMLSLTRECRNAGGNRWQMHYKPVNNSNAQQPRNLTASQRQNTGYETICELAELGSCPLARDPITFERLCSTPDYDCCSRFNQMFEGQFGNPLAILSEKDEE
jgi:hypothetical protein